MVEVIIDKIDNYNYYLKDKNGNIHIINIEFYGLEKEVNIGDKIYLKESLLKRIEKQMVNFSIVEKMTDKNNEEFLMINYSDGTKKYLNRIYG